MSAWTKFGPHLKELRIHLCQTGCASRGAREFIRSNYVKIKSANPTLPILIRECSGVEPKVWARFEKGQECNASLSELSVEEVKEKLQELVA